MQTPRGYTRAMLSRRTTSPCATFGLLLVAPLLAMSLLFADETPAPERAGDGAPALVDEREAAASEDREIAEDGLRGLWMRYATRGEGDPIRFWYFHGDGKGLYRYGRVGLANTHSFDYRVLDDGQLFLRFRKPGDEHVTSLELERDEGGRLWLRMGDDPREPGARYRKVESDLDFAAAARPDPAPSPAGDDDSGLGDRIWIDYQSYATGGSGFHMYQLAATAIDGRGVGWFHRGDFDEWSTESLTYRIDGDRIELFFDIREEPNSTAYRVLHTDDGRVLELRADPRDFWARHRYRDGGRSFGSHAFDRVLGLERALAEL